MEQNETNLLLLFIVFLLIVIDILRNHKIFRSRKTLFAGIVSYMMIIGFFVSFILYPSNRILPFIFIVLGAIPYGYYWYQRTTISERRNEAIITGILILAVILYFLTKMID